MASRFPRSQVVGSARARARHHLAVLVCVGAMLAAACTDTSQGSAAVRVITHRDFHLPADALEAFTESTGIEVVIFREDTPDDVIELLDRSRAHPVADVVVGIDTLDVLFVVENGLTQSYVPLAPGPLTEGLAVEDHALTPVSYIDACLNYLPSFYVVPDRPIDELPALDVLPPPVPRGLDALHDPAHAGTAVIPDAATSRMGVYLLVALERLHPERDGDEVTPWPQILDQMLRWGVELEPSWETSVFERFAGGEPPPQRPVSQDVPDPVTLSDLGGRLPVAWGTTGLPAVYATYQPGLPEALDIAVVTDDCVRIGFYAGVVAGAPNESLGGRLIDFMGEPLFQFGVSDRFGSRPARSDIVSTPEWREFGVTVIPYRPDPAYVGANWKEWQLTWSQVVRNFETAPPPPEPEVTVTLP